MLKNKAPLTCLLLLTAACVHARQLSTAIKLNQCGFYPNAPKVAVITGPVAERNFYITTTNLRDTVFRGTLSEEKNSAYSTTKTRVADFSALTAQGSFVIAVPGLGHSYVFSIRREVNRNAATAVLKGYYYQRVSMPLEEAFAGKWRRSAGHPDNKVLVHAGAASSQRPEGTVIATPGGWYDAGDYNKYIVNSGITMGTLLAAYEDFPAYFRQLRTNIPESNDAIPDILNEVIYNLRWMLTMQDPADGGVYNKCTNAAFDGMIMPGITTAPRYVVQKGTAATLDFAAVTAQAARILKQYDARLADSCVKAAHKAWQWALQHPALAYNQDSLNKVYQPVISTGPYGDRYFNDEWFWAASELYLTTRQEKFYAVVQQHMGERAGLPSWANVGMLGYYSFLRSKDLPTKASGMVIKMREKVLAMADDYIAGCGRSAFGTVMGQSVRDFVWGSNAVAANQGVVLLNAYMLTREKKYVDYALTNLDYILGRNATGYSFVTGIGSKSPMHPHHRLSVADGVTDPVPGLLAGGPNPGRQDKCSYEFTEPETAYSDNACSYASNEIAINWNAPMVYLANAIEALAPKIGYNTAK